MKIKNWILFAGVTFVLCAPPHMKAAVPLPVSGVARTNVAGSGSSLNPAFSTDGRFVVFVSHANNLVTNDDLAPYLDVFVRDITTSNTVLVSVNTSGRGGGNADSHSPSISSNGQFVAFVSAASNLVNNDTNDAPDIFVRDLVAGTTSLVTFDSIGNTSAGNVSARTRSRLASNPVISANGQWVIFESLATNLVTLQDANQLTDIFARDRQANATFLVSVNADATGSGNGNSEWPGISPDGRFVVFVSTSTDLVAGVTNQSGDIYVRDLQLGTTVWASRNATNYFENGYRCFNPVISADGRFATFKASSSLNAPVFVIRHDLQTGVSTVLTSNSFIASWPEMSTDGRFVSSESSSNVYVWDGQTGSNVWVSVNASGSGPGNGTSQCPVMTPDGQTVVFLSGASDLSANATNGVWQVYARDLTAGATRLVSANTDGLASSRNLDAILPGITSDGRLVAFESLGNDLVSNDLNQAADAFVRDLASETTELVSRRHVNAPETTGAALSTVAFNSISADGRFVLFGSFDNDFIVGDTNQLQDAYRHDLSAGTFELASVDTDGSAFQNQTVVQSVLSADGKFAAFVVRTNIPLSVNGLNVFRRDFDGETTTLINTDTNGWHLAGASTNVAMSSDGRFVAFQTLTDGGNVYLRDLETGITQWINTNSFHELGGVDLATPPTFSPDGRWVVFASRYPRLLTNSPGALLSLYARDLASNTTSLISIDPAGYPGWGYTGGAVLSADSRWVAFVSSNLSVTVFDLEAKTSAVVCAGCNHPSISADGRLVACQTAAGGTTNNVVFDRQTGTSNLISINRSGTGGGNSNSTAPLLSWDGRFVVFSSKASDLVDNDTNGVSDIFVRDRLLGITILVSLNLQGTGSANGTSSKPVLAADGRTIVFQSLASDLIPGDYNYRRDVFVLHLGGADIDGDGADIDGDGVDDDWEMAYFGTLARDGDGDFDGDGQTDLDEFRTGTDPTNSGSVLRVLRLTVLNGDGARLIWVATPGKTYRVQFKENLQDIGWNHLPGEVLATGTTSSMLDNSALASHRFYRVVLVH